MTPSSCREGKVRKTVVESLETTRFELRNYYPLNLKKERDPVAEKKWFS
jgi:hypothetical protein